MDEGKRTKTGEAERTSEKSGKNRKKRKKVIRRLIAAAVILVVLGFAGFIVARKLQADYSVIYDPYTASIGTITNSLSYSGSMQLINNETYTASSATKVREVYVSQGDSVQEGDRLIRLNDGTTVTAAFSGTVNRIDVAKGDTVTKDQNLVQVTDYDNMRVTFRVGESDIQDVRAGQEVMITVSSIGARFSSAIDNIDYSTYTGNSVAYYTATVDVDTSGISNIYPGMQATITIPQEEASNAVILKMDAITTAGDNTAFVYKQAEDGTMTEVPVTVGVSNGNYVEIRSGVSDGETVYAVQEKEETSMTSILASLFGSQRVNAPQQNYRNRQNMDSGGNGSFPGGGMTPGGNGNGTNQTNRNRGN